MASLSKLNLLFVLIVMSSMLVASSEARLSHQFSVLPEKINSKLILRQLGYDVSKLENYGGRRMLNSDTQRVAPGGPDPQHH